MRLLYHSFSLCFFLTSLVWAQDSTTTTEEGSIIGVETAPFPTATGPQCLEPRSPDEPSGSDISQALTDDGTISKACNVENQSVDTIGQLLVISYGLHGYFFNISHNVNVVSKAIARPNQCPDAFNSILDVCVTGSGTHWGGYTQGGIANYSITNHVYPESPFAQPNQSVQNATGREISTTTTLNAGISSSTQFTTGSTSTLNAGPSATTTQTKNTAGNSISLPPGATVMTSIISGTIVTETFIPTTYPEYASLLTTTSITTVNSQGGGVTSIVGPGGVAWIPIFSQTGGPQIQPTDAPFRSTTSTQPTTSTSTSTTRNANTATTSTTSPIVSQGSATKTTTNPGTTATILPIITTAFDVQAATLTSVDPVITGNTAISTGDGTHSWGLYPFFHGGSHCLWCPPGLDNGGLVFWGITKPGEYDNIQPPIPNIVKPMPDIVVNNDLIPSAKDDAQEENEDEDKITETQSTKTSTSETSTGSCTASTVVQDCEVLCNDESSSQSCSTTCMPSTIPCSGRGTTVTSMQTGACEIPRGYSTTLAPVAEPSKGLGKGSVVLPGGGATTSGASSTISTTTTDGSSGSVSDQGGQTTTTIPDTLVTSRRTESSSTQTTPSAAASTTSKYVPPAWQCPNDGVRQNAPGCPTPTTSTGGPLRCSTGSNVGLATYNPATWCGCNGQIYSTISGATSDYCAYTTAPISTIRPTQVPIPSTTISTSVAPPAPTANCDFYDEVLFWSFTISNINGWAGDGGGSLKTQEKGCGGLTGWEWHVDDGNHQHAFFNLPFTIKQGCVERAIKSAGGPGALSCKGHGLKRRSEKPSIEVQDSPVEKQLRIKKYGNPLSEHRFTHQYVSDKDMDAANANVSRRSLVSRAHTDAWNKYAPKGIQYYNEWKNRPADQEDKAALCNFDETYSFSKDPLAVTGPYDPIKPYINGAKGQTYTNFQWHWPKGPTNLASAIFWNNISPVDNAIIAFSNDRGGDEEEGEDRSPDNWSDMVWWLWLRATASGGDKSSLSQIFRYNVDNEASKEILEEILGDKQDEVVTLQPDEAQSQDNGFWALLGCPNGTGMIHLVGDHKKALNGKGIKSISCIYNRREDQYYMWGNLG